MSPTQDKRQHPRIAQRLAVRTRDTSGVELETINLSAGGLSCNSPAFLAPMTRMALSLELPAQGAIGSAVVEGEAVVVRTDPPQSSATHSGAYRIALFFSRMEDEHRRLLKDYLEARLR